MTEQWFTGPGMITPLGLARRGMDRRRPGVGGLTITGHPSGVGASTTDSAGAGASVAIHRTHGGEGGRIAGALSTTAAVVAIMAAVMASVTAGMVSVTAVAASMAADMVAVTAVAVAMGVVAVDAADMAVIGIEVIWLPNPNGIEASSPGLRGTRYPG